MEVESSALREPEVLVIAANWNGCGVLSDFLDKTLSSTYENLGIVVVDNASTDGSAEIALGRERVRLLKLNENRGWGAAINAGLAASGPGPDYYLFMNNDVFLEPGAVESLIRCIEDRPRFGLLSPILLNLRGAITHSGGRFTSLGWWSPQLVDPATSPGDVTELDLVIGAAIFAKAEVVDRIGGFDPEFFLYREDVDFCRRARRAGFSIGVCHDARATHVGGAATLKQDEARPHSFDPKATYRESFAKYAFKHLSATELARWSMTARGRSSFPYVWRNLPHLLRIRRRSCQKIELGQATHAGPAATCQKPIRSRQIDR